MYPTSLVPAAISVAPLFFLSLVSEVNDVSVCSDT